MTWTPEAHRARHAELHQALETAMAATPGWEDNRIIDWLLAVAGVLDRAVFPFVDELVADWIQTRPNRYPSMRRPGEPLTPLDYRLRDLQAWSAQQAVAPDHAPEPEEA